jgi:hypothetical protein
MTKLQVVQLRESIDRDRIAKKAKEPSAGDTIPTDAS